VDGSSRRVLALGQPGVPGGEGAEDADKQEIANQDTGQAHRKALSAEGGNNKHQRYGHELYFSESGS
jgi:hypothetical protein